MVRSVLSSQEKRELLAELTEHFKSGELGPQTFRGQCKDAGIDDDDVAAAVAAHKAENAKNWRAR